MGHPAARGEFADLPRIERGLGGEVEAVGSRTLGKWAIFRAISTRRSSLRAISRSTRKASASPKLSSRFAASSNRLSSWSRIAVSLSRVSEPSRLS
jgi:hypothetical protein